jgi:hypothetical protein
VLAGHWQAVLEEYQQGGGQGEEAPVAPIDTPTLRKLFYESFKYLEVQHRLCYPQQYRYDFSVADSDMQMTKELLVALATCATGSLLTSQLAEAPARFNMLALAMQCCQHTTPEDRSSLTEQVLQHVFRFFVATLQTTVAELRPAGLEARSVMNEALVQKLEPDAVDLVVQALHKAGVYEYKEQDPHPIVAQLKRDLSWMSNNTQALTDYYLSRSVKLALRGGATTPHPPNQPPPPPIQSHLPLWDHHHHHHGSVSSSRMQYLKMLILLLGNGS